MRTNRYAGKCLFCGQWVKAQAGGLVKADGKWKAYHHKCNDAVDSAPKVSYYTTSGGTFASCNCEDFPCCGHGRQF